MTVIDYFSRYLLALQLTPHNDALVLAVAADQAIAVAEGLHSPLGRMPTLVTENSSNFLSRRFREHIDGLLCQVHTRYRAPQQLGLLGRFHQALRRKEVY